MSDPGRTDAADSLRTSQYRDSRNLSARIDVHARFSVNPLPWHRFVFDHFGLPVKARVLELGSGVGSLWKENAERIPAEWRIVLADFSPGMLADARGRLSGMREFAFLAANAQAIACADASFDCVVANHMLYHVPDIPEALREIHRVLRPGGRFLAATNGAAHLRELGDLLGEAGIGRDDGRVWPRDTERFTLDNGGDLIAPCFPDVVLHRYEDALEVTEAEPLVAYAASMVSVHATEEHLARLRTLAESRLTRDGSIHIGKEAGVFVASRDP